jgi:hypothetical protein
MKNKNLVAIFFGFMLFFVFFGFVGKASAALCQCARYGILSDSPVGSPTNVADDAACNQFCINSHADLYYYNWIVGAIQQAGKFKETYTVAPQTQNTTPETTNLGPNPFTYIPMEQIPGQPDSCLNDTTGAPVNLNANGTCPAGSRDTRATDFYTYVGYLYKFGIAAVGIAALFMIIVGGFMYITSAGNNAKMESAKGVITDAIVGLILALSAYLILYTINPELVNIRPIKSLPVSPITGAANTPITSGTTVAPPSTSTPINGTTSTGSLVTSKCPGVTTDLNLCTTTTCSKVCTNLNTFITTYASQNNIGGANGAAGGIKVVKAVICRESGGDPNAVNTHGSVPSCGLMQVNVSSGTSCTSDPRYGNLLDPENNIKVGTSLLAGKIANISGRNYGLGITPYHLAFAAYNCCGTTGENPNDNSRDCGSTVPKWACAVNPGTGTYNMCAVHDYACDVQACAFMY